MSHFSVLVIGENPKEQLEPFQENNMDDCPSKYLEFKDQTEEFKEEYENKDTEMLKLADGTLKYTWDSNKLTEDEKKTATKIKIKHKDRYKTFDEFCKGWHSAEKDEKKGVYGYWHNPNSKWDWYSIGGRWSGSLKLKDGATGTAGEGSTFTRCDPKLEKERLERLETHTDQARIKDIDFSPDMDEYNKAKRFWELYVEGEKVKTKADKDLIDFVMYKKEYYTKRYKNKEEYAKLQSEFSTFAVLKDGVWHEKGEMGWFGCSSATPEEESKWDKSYFDTFLKDLPPETLITVVDCHI